jgi:hypothetical protein
MMWPFARKPVPEPQPTFGDMIAYSLTHATTRGDWTKINWRTARNKKLGFEVEEDLFNNVADASEIGGDKVPLDYADRRKIYHALNSWREWDKAQKHAAALVRFADKFSETYGGDVA